MYCVCDIRFLGQLPENIAFKILGEWSLFKNNWQSDKIIQALTQVNNVDYFNFISNDLKEKSCYHRVALWLSRLISTMIHRKNAKNIMIFRCWIGIRTYWKLTVDLKKNNKKAFRMHHAVFRNPMNLLSDKLCLLTVVCLIL